jgi:thiol-disulfide isomerase/thioredoxin
MKNNLVFLFFTLTFVLGPGCIVIESPFKGLPPGKWIGVLQLDKEISGMPRVEKEDINPNISFEMVNAGELPFEFEVHYANEDSFYIHLINASDTFVISDIKYGTDRSKAKDTFEIHFPMYNTLLKGYFEENVMEGEWLVLDKENYRIPFVARYGKQNKFTDLKKTPSADISGVWKVNMGIDSDKPSVMMASFEQSGNAITGTFSAPSGDYRFLSGTVQGNKLYLSQFDGATAYLIEAKIEEDGSLSGLFRSGKHYQTLWTAVRDESFVLEVPVHSPELTGKSVSFTYKDESGAQVSLEDPAFQGKPKVLQIMGSWCHNCYDEGRFFTNLPSRYKDGISFLGLAVERASSEEAAFKRMKAFRKQTGVEYPLLLVSTTTQKEEVLKAMPFLDKLEAYPTTVFLNERNEIVEVKSGFFGPASHLHETWRKDFFTSLDKLLKNE